MKSSVFRPVQLVLLGAITLILAALLLTSWLTWREQARLSAARGVLLEALAFHEQHGVVERGVVDLFRAPAANTAPDLLAQIAVLEELCATDDQATRTLLARLRTQLAGGTAATGAGPEAALALVQEIALSEARFGARRLADLVRASDSHRQLELGAPVALVLVLLIAYPIARRRVVKPLEDFGRQLNELASGEYTPTPETEVSEHTLPLHRSLLKLALRLQELEREQRERAESLEEEVRAATSALLEQQRSLARAERLAVAGELAASVAHEIRNPLAGIQMSLANLRHELTDPALAERVDRIVAEVSRLARLVGELVDASRHEPELPTEVDLAALVDELLSLTRYQLPTRIRLESRTEAGLRARLPRERLRQALLNLVLNSSHAIGDAAGTIEIAIEREGDGVVVRVSDDGPGFPSELLEGGILPFRSTRSRGTGLGLAMVRRFVRDAGGSMRLENRAPRGERPGARVTLLLPSAATPA